MRSKKKGLARLLFGFSVVVALLVTNATPSAALTNHTNTVQNGSSIAITGGRTFPLAGSPQCSDGTDNDQDSSIDAADADCDAGGVGQPQSADNNECLNGFQAAPAAPTMTFQDSGTGTLSAFNVSLSPSDVCASTLIGQLCFRVTITVNSASATGSVTNIVANTSANVAAGPFSFTVAVATCGYKNPPGFSATNCRTTFSNVNFSTTNPGGVQYLESNRTSTLTASIPSGPSFAAGTCGSFLGVDYAGQLNSNLGLPNVVNVTLKGQLNTALSSV